MNPEKKGQCPVSFLWRGDGTGKNFMILGIVIIFGAMFLSVIFLNFGHNEKIFRPLFLAGGLVWFFGKGLCMFASYKNGAQKRTRTSTK